MNDITAKRDSSKYLGPNVYALTVAQRRLGNTIHVFCRGNGSIDEIDGMTIHRIKGSLSKGTLNELFRRRKINTFDVMHMHATAGFAAASFMRKTKSVPLVTHVHGTTIGSSFLADTPHTNVTRVALSLVSERFAWKNSTRVIAVSQSIGQELAKYYGVSWDRIRVVYNGVDTDMFKPDPAREAKRTVLGWQGKKVVLYVGRIAPLKGLIDLIHAAQFLALKDNKILIAIVGDVARFQYGSTIGFAKQLRELVTSLGLQDRILFMGSIANSNLPEMYSSADAFVLPSLTEGTPKAVLEAMACETPCVLTRVGGMPELIGTSEGILVPPRNPNALAEALGRLLENENDIRKMGRSARIRVLQKFTWSIAASEIAKIYSEL